MLVIVFQMQPHHHNSETQRLKDAVNALYREFDAPAPDVIEGCPCCIDTRGTDALLNTPLRQISGEAIWRYVTGAFFTVGSERDFRYLMPRIFELGALSPNDVPEQEIILNKLRLANWQAWKPTERASVDEFLDAWFDYALAQDISEVEDGWFQRQAESVLCGIAIAGLSIGKWLAKLKEPSASLVLADLAERVPNGLTGFWEDAPRGMIELQAMLKDR